MLRATVEPAVTPARIDTNGEPLGALARRVFSAQRRSPYRQVHINRNKKLRLRYRLLIDLLRIQLFARRHGPTIRRLREIPVTSQLLQLLRLAIVHRVDPGSYYAHHLYDAPLGLGEVTHYLSRTEMKNGIYSLLNALRRGDPHYGFSLSEKVEFTEHCRNAGLPVVPILAVARAGTWEGVSPDDLDCDLFVKSIRGRGARWARAYRRIAPGRYQAADGTALSGAALVEQITAQSQRVPMMIARNLTNHPEIADLAVQSLITFRVFTCFDPAGEPVVTHAMLRTLSKLEPDWQTEEEFAVAIDLTTGRLGAMCGDANLAPDAWWDRHPKTGAPVTGRILTHWPELAALAIRAHRVFSARMVIGWDLALTPDGPVVIEGNSDPDTHFLQRVHRQMIGRSPLAPLLRHHLRAAEQLLEAPTSPSVV
jgi:hypothetical protein